MTYYYKRTEPKLWTVGHDDQDGKFQPESDHGSPEEAAERVLCLLGVLHPAEGESLVERVKQLENSVRWLEARFSAHL